MNEMESLADGTKVRLRETLEADLPHFFEHQREPEGRHRAAFTLRDADDEAAFYAHWKKIWADKSLILRTILVDDAVAGYVSMHSWFGAPELSYWLGQAFWGRGVATAALRCFLPLVPHRPLMAHVVFDNAASLRVLEKSGFVVVGEGTWFAAARGKVERDIVLRLD
jgi:RimJ/RimL family protein N-acetyltransferase